MHAKALRFETRIETALEGERFFDLVRWGIEEIMNKFFRCEEDNRVYYKNVKFTSGRDEYYPIPLTQYNLAKGGTQNRIWRFLICIIYNNRS